MSYNGTVYCSYCGKKGHNRRGCESRKDYIKGNPDSYEARVANRRKEEARPRACSYCKVPHHTRRTCDTLKSDRAILVKKLAAQRQKALEKMTAKGIGVGTLIETKYSYYDASKAIAMVVSIPWRNANDPDAITVRFQFLKDGYQRGATFSFAPDQEIYRSYAPLEVVSGLSAIDVHAGAPSSWLNGTLYDEDDYFPKGQERRSWFFEDDYQV